MIESFWLENFKAFGERQTIPLKKITLLFGANSAGKSTVLQALLMLKQSMQELDDAQGALLPKGNLVDLGSGSEMTFRHETERSIRFGFATSLRPARDALLPLVTGTYTFAPAGQRRLQVSELSIEEQQRPVIRFIPTRGDDDSTFDRRAVHFKGELLNPESALVKSAYAAFDGRIQSILAELINVPQNDRAWQWRAASQHVLPIYDLLMEPKPSVREAKSVEQFAHALQQQFSATIEKYQAYDEPTFVRDLTDALLKTDVAGYGLRFRTRAVEHGGTWGTAAAPDAGILSSVVQFTADVTREIQRMSYVGPYRATPERLYIFLGLDPRDLGRSGQNLPHILYKRPNLVKRLNQWLERMGVGYQIDVHKYSKSEDIEGVFSLRMNDQNLNDSVSWADVGFGISQLLPILVQAVQPENRLVLVEQPELHLHPRLQAEFGTILAESIRVEGANRFVIETHSEHLILRLQRHIRRGELSADDISVVHVRRGSDGSIAKTLRMDKDGQFVDRWPEGFFEEGFVERFAE